MRDFAVAVTYPCKALLDVNQRIGATRAPSNALIKTRRKGQSCAGEEQDAGDHRSGELHDGGFNGRVGFAEMDGVAKDLRKAHCRLSFRRAVFIRSLSSVLVKLVTKIFPFI